MSNKKPWTKPKLSTIDGADALIERVRGRHLNAIEQRKLDRLLIEMRRHRPGSAAA